MRIELREDRHDLAVEIEEFMDGLAQQAELAPPQAQAEPPPDPKMQLAEKQAGFEMQKMDREREAMEMEHGLKREDIGFQREQLTAKQNEASMTAQVEMQRAAIEAERDIRVAEVSRPRLEDTAPFQPMFEALGGQLMSGIQALAQQQQQGMEQLGAVMRDGLTQIAQIAASPRDVKVERDRSGKITGAKATPQVAGNA